jgi:hypothetical protein
VLKFGSRIGKSFSQRSIAMVHLQEIKLVDDLGSLDAVLKGFPFPP